MAHPQTIPIFGQMEDTSVQVSHLWSPSGWHIWPRAPGLTSVMTWNDLNCSRILGPWRLFESDLNNSPSQAIPILGQMEDTPIQVSYLWSSGGCNTWPGFNNGPRGNSNNGRVLASLAFIRV